MSNAHNCTQCNGEFRSKYLLQKHLKVCSKEMETPSQKQCGLCDFTAPTKLQIMEHMSSHVAEVAPNQGADLEQAEEDPLNTGEGEVDMVRDEVTWGEHQNGAIHHNADNHQNGDLHQRQEEPMSHAVTCLWLDPEQPTPNICATLLSSMREVHDHIVNEHVNGEHVDQACFWNGCARYGRYFRARNEFVLHLQEHTGINEQYPCTVDGCDEVII